MRTWQEVEAVYQEIAAYDFPFTEVERKEARLIVSEGGHVTATNEAGEPISLTDAAEDARARFVHHTAVEKTSGQKTGKFYDTTGFGYQFVVNAMNEILHLDGWETEQTFKVEEGETSKKKRNFTVVAEISLLLHFDLDGSGEKVRTIRRHSNGSHTSLDYGDAMKGAYTNGLKKGAAMAGFGRTAYEGTVDDDNIPLPEARGEGTVAKPATGTTPGGRTARTGREEPADMKQEAPAEPPKEAWRDHDPKLVGFWTETKKLVGKVKVPDGKTWEDGVLALLRMNYNLDLKSDARQTAGRDDDLGACFRMLRDCADDTRAFTVIEALKFEAQEPADDVPFPRDEEAPREA